MSCDTNAASTRERASGHGWAPPEGCEDTGRVVAPCKLGIKPRARVNSFSRARVKGSVEVFLPINSTVLYRLVNSEMGPDVLFWQFVL
eukprot:COSAG01_NODE_1737_length_9362_cov_165.799309_4_plen_88_part_00